MNLNNEAKDLLYLLEVNYLLCRVISYCLSDVFIPSGQRILIFLNLFDGKLSV